MADGTGRIAPFPSETQNSTTSLADIRHEHLPETGERLIAEGMMALAHEVRGQGYEPSLTEDGPALMRWTPYPVGTRAAPAPETHFIISELDLGIYRYGSNGREPGPYSGGTRSLRTEPRHSVPTPYSGDTRSADFYPSGTRADRGGASLILGAANNDFLPFVDLKNRGLLEPYAGMSVDAVLFGARQTLGFYPSGTRTFEDTRGARISREVAEEFAGFETPGLVETRLGENNIWRQEGNHLPLEVDALPTPEVIVVNRERAFAQELAAARQRELVARFDFPERTHNAAEQNHQSLFSPEDRLATRAEVRQLRQLNFRPREEFEGSTSHHRTRHAERLIGFDPYNRGEKLAHSRRGRTFGRTMRHEFRTFRGI